MAGVGPRREGSPRAPCPSAPPHGTFHIVRAQLVASAGRRAAIHRRRRASGPNADRASRPKTLAPRPIIISSTLTNAAAAGAGTMSPASARWRATGANGHTPTAAADAVSSTKRAATRSMEGGWAVCSGAVPALISLPCSPPWPAGRAAPPAGHSRPGPPTPETHLTSSARAARCPGRKRLRPTWPRWAPRSTAWPLSSRPRPLEAAKPRSSGTGRGENGCRASESTPSPTPGHRFLSCRPWPDTPCMVIRSRRCLRVSAPRSDPPRRTKKNVSPPSPAPSPPPQATRPCPPAAS